MSARRIVIASQLPEQINQIFLDTVAGVELRPVARGVPKRLDEDVEVFFAVPFGRSAADWSHAPPPGWPFAVRWIQLISAGIDVYPSWLFGDIPVTNARGASALPLAEYALTAIFAAAKRLPQLWIHAAEDWRMVGVSQVEGTTLGLVGFGAISAALAPKALALGMKVLAVRRGNAPLPVGVERAAGLEDLLARSDHVVLACAATPETAGMVNDKLLRHAKRGLHLINVARGTLIDDGALLTALDDGRLGLATLDCTSPEPLPAGHPFYVHPRIRLSAHTSVIVPDYFPQLAQLMARNFIRYREGRPLDNIVNPTLGY
jgi:phosphoglycerate dehydrogenase-like enzyme